MQNPHSPAELAEISTLIHNVAGWLFAVLAAALLAENLRGVPAGRWRFAWPALGMLIGFGLTAYIFAHMRGTHGVSPFADPQQVQHQLIGLAIGTGAALETLRRANVLRGPAFEAAWPVALIAVGVVFVAHEQARFDALLVHWVLAATVVLSGLAQCAAVLSGEPARAMRLLAALLLAAGAAQLIAYREAPGAHAHEAAPSEPAAPHGSH